MHVDVVGDDIFSSTFFDAHTGGLFTLFTLALDAFASISLVD